MSVLLEVYDIETLINLFTYTGYCRTTKKWYQFVIHPLRNDYKKLVEHLKRENLIQIGFNNLSFDYTVLHHLLNHSEYANRSPLEIANSLYEKSQEVIGMEYSIIAEKNRYIKQIDLFKIWHYDNMARSCSLKHLEFALRLDNVEEMPFHHTHWITTMEEIEAILSYNKHDVFTTDKFLDITAGNTDHILYKGKNKIELRQRLSKFYNMNLLNLSDVKMGEDIMLKLYSESIGVPSYYVKKLRTPRPVINFKDCIPKYIKFTTLGFQKLHKKWLTTSITSTKGAISESVIFHGIKIDYGTGGLHASKSGIFKSDDYWMIVDSDVSSLYPSIGVQNKYSPDHLGKIFYELYADFVNTRLAEKEKPKKLRDMVIMEGYKLFTNGAYGKSNSEDSFLYDPLYTMQVTITGQLSLSMLIEMITLSIPELEFIQFNTDGITLKIPKHLYYKYLEICKEWEIITKLILEHAEYDLIVVRDVNNYLSRYINGDLKLKGVFEIDKEFHKDQSSRIVPIALKEYFDKGIPVEDTIKNHTDIFDFCCELKVNKGWQGLYKHINYDSGKIEEKKLNRTTRYYVSTKGGVLIKENVDDPSRRTGVNVGQSVILFNKYTKHDMIDYNINYNYYIHETNKIINSIVDTQLRLF